MPQLAAEIPSRQNGGLAADGRTVTWKLKRGVSWHDGKPFTADDVVFTAAYAADPAVAMITVATYRDIQVLKLDTHTVQVIYPKPVAHWAEALTGRPGVILPKHVFEPFMGAKSRDNPANFKPVGTGPYRLVDFKPGDMVRAEAYAGYHVPHQPHFDALEIKGGGDAVSAARAVLQTGEYDLDKAVRTAISLLVDRKGLQEAVLDAAGWARGADGIRAKTVPAGNVRLKFVFQTTVNGERQKVQAVINDACSKAGIDIEIKAVTPAVFSGGDVANPDTNQKFWADLQMHQFTMNEPDPQAFMERFTSEQAAQKVNTWGSRNTQRWSNAEYDTLFKAAQIELDPVKRAAMFIGMNDILVGDGYVIPLSSGRRTLAAANPLVPALSAWDANTWAIGYWYREA